MPFFDILDNGRFAKLKMSILNGMTEGSVTQPVTLNEMYLLAEQWLNTNGTLWSGLASTFITKLGVPVITQIPGNSKIKGKSDPASDNAKAEGDAKPR
jgi:hypothetical protein